MVRPDYFTRACAGVVELRLFTERQTFRFTLVRILQGLYHCVRNL